MPSDAAHEILAIDTVVNPITPEILKTRPDWTDDFYTSTVKREARVTKGYSYAETLAMMDAAGMGAPFWSPPRSASRAWWGAGPCLTRPSTRR